MAILAAAAALVVLALAGAAIAVVPSNDDFANAETITGATGTVARSTVDATNEDGFFIARDVWYQWTAPADGEQLFVLHVPHTPFSAPSTSAPAPPAAMSTPAPAPTSTAPSTGSPHPKPPTGSASAYPS